jgi:hypothetical protein
MDFEIKIEKGIPVKGKAFGVINTIREMKQGESFVFPSKMKSRICSTANYIKMKDPEFKCCPNYQQ